MAAWHYSRRIMENIGINLQNHSKRRQLYNYSRSFSRFFGSNLSVITMYPHPVIARIIHPIITMYPHPVIVRIIPAVITMYPHLCHCEDHSCCHYDVSSPCHCEDHSCCHYDVSSPCHCEERSDVAIYEIIIQANPPIQDFI